MIKSSQTADSSRICSKEVFCSLLMGHTESLKWYLHSKHIGTSTIKKKVTIFYLYVVISNCLNILEKPTELKIQVNMGLDLSKPVERLKKYIYRERFKNRFNISWDHSIFTQCLELTTVFTSRWDSQKKSCCCRNRIFWESHLLVRLSKYPVPTTAARSSLNTVRVNKSIKWIPISILIIAMNTTCNHRDSD